jgi:hypothetical protein
MVSSICISALEFRVRSRRVTLALMSWLWATAGNGSSNAATTNAAGSAARRMLGRADLRMVLAYWVLR